MLQDKLLAGLLEILKTLLQGAQTNDTHAKQAALAKSSKIARGLKP